MIEQYGIIRQVSLSKYDDKELWSFVINGDDKSIISLDFLMRHYPNPIITADSSFSIVTFKSEDGGVFVEVKIPRNEIPASISDIRIFEGKFAVIKDIE